MFGGLAMGRLGLWGGKWHGEMARSDELELQLSEVSIRTMVTFMTRGSSIECMQHAE